MRKNKEITKYIVIGVLTTLINWLIYAVLVNFGTLITIANALSWCGAVAFAFFMSRDYVFQNSEKSILKQAILFFLSRIFTGAIEIILPTLITLLGLNSTPLGIKGFWGKLITTAVVIVLNYILSKCIVFRNKNGVPTYNYHTHTPRCHHASGDEREFIENAIVLGITDFGFADHAPYIFPDKDYVDGAKMSMDDASEYFDTLLSLKEEYKDKINIYIGFEAEYYESCFDKTLNELIKYPLDYLILGQHKIGDFDTQLVFDKTTDEKDLKQYVDTVIKAIGTGKFSYIAHPDVINFQGDDNVYKKEMRRLCLAAKQQDIPLEINLLGATTGRHYPGERFFKIAGEVGNSVIIGRDAHSPDMLYNEKGMNKCLEIINKFALKSVKNLKFKELR